MDPAKEKLIGELEKEAERLHNSTRTDIPVLSPAHNYFRSRYAFYYVWSLHSATRVVHFYAFLAFVLATLFTTLGQSLFLFFFEK